MMLITALVLISLFVGIVVWIPNIKDKPDEVYFAIGVATITYIMLSVGLHFAVKQSQGIETMVLNGYVTKKQQERTSCSHSYSCNCRTVKSGKTTTTKCDTCYEHTHDYDWVVYSSLGDYTYINTIDRQGKEEPPRFTSVKIGEAYSIEQQYFSYIKASPLSVFKDYKEYDKEPIPSQPKVYDYYRLKHVVDWKSEYKNTQEVNTLLTQALATTSGKIKANAIVIFYGGSESIVNATRVKTLGGRINDVTIFINADVNGNIRKVHAYSWSKNDIVHVKLRDDILAMKTIDNQKLVDIINNDLLKYYKHRSNEEFAYLEHNIQFPVWYYVMQGILCALYIGLNLYGRFKL